MTAKIRFGSLCLLLVVGFISWSVFMHRADTLAHWNRYAEAHYNYFGAMASSLLMLLVIGILMLVPEESSDPK